MYTILIVDDEPLAIKSIYIILKNSDLPIKEILCAENGFEALKIIKERQCDIVFTDIRMPEMDGLELCKEINEIDSKTRIVIISGYDDFSYAKKSIKYGVKDYILKPVSTEEVIATVNQIIEEDNRRREIYISQVEVNNLIELIVREMWNKNYERFELATNDLINILGKAKEDYIIKFQSDFTENILSRISAKVGYRFRMELPEHIYGNFDDFQKWLRSTLENIARELDDRREKSDINLFNMVNDYLNENYDKDVSLELIAKITGFSPSYFSQIFKTKSGKSFVQYKNEIRIQKAMHLLNTTGSSVTSVAFEVGYNDVTYFTRAFKEYIGVTPSEYKKRGFKK